MKTLLAIIHLVLFVGLPNTLDATDIVRKYSLSSEEVSKLKSLNNDTEKGLLLSKIMINKVPSWKSLGKVKFQVVLTKNVDIGSKAFFLVNIMFDNELPEVIYKSEVLLANIDAGYVFSTPMHDVQIFKQKDSASIYMGGYIEFRGEGYYHIYLCTDKRVKQIFTTNPMLFYDNTAQCSVLKNGKLQLIYEDINSDGFYDLILQGVRLYYCEYDDQGRGETAKVLKEKKIEEKFIFDPNSKSWIWVKSKSTK